MNISKSKLVFGKKICLLMTMDKRVYIRRSEILEKTESNEIGR